MEVIQEAAQFNSCLYKFTPAVPKPAGVLTSKLWEPAEKPVYTQTQWRTESTTHETGKQSSPKQLDQNEVEKKVYFPQYTQICSGIYT